MKVTKQNGGIEKKNNYEKYTVTKKHNLKLQLQNEGLCKTQDTPIKKGTS